MLFVFLLGMIATPTIAQDKLFTLDDCIKYALENSTTIGRASNEVFSQASDLEQRKAERGPNLSLAASETFNSNGTYDNTGDQWSRKTNSNMNVSLSSNITLYNGARIKNSILQGKINVSAAETDIKTKEELLSLDVLSAYIFVLQAKEQLKNSKTQLEATEKSLEDATIRREAGVMSPVDYLNIKSQYASDKAALVNSQSALHISKISIMQTINMPVSNTFDIAQPDTDNLLKMNAKTDASIVYNFALKIQPSVKTAALDLESSAIDIKLAKTNGLPNLSLFGGIQSNYSTVSNLGFSNQFSNQLTPAIGINLSIPIYQRKEVKNKVKQASIARQNFEYNLIDIKNDLRKAIEQACADAQTANSAYLSYEEQYLAEQESYKLAAEMFSQGMLNSVDFISSKNNLSTAENNLTKAKYGMILQNEIIDYYMGNKIEF